MNTVGKYKGFDLKVCHPLCVYNKLGCVYTCLTQLYGGRDMYNLLHKNQPEDGQCKGPKHVNDLYVINYTYLYHYTVVLDKYTHTLI